MRRYYNCSIEASMAFILTTFYRLHLHCSYTVTLVTPVGVVYGPKPSLTFLPLLTGSLLTKIGIIYIPLLQREEKIIPVMPKMLKKLSEKLRANLLPFTPGCSMIQISPLDDASLKDFEPQASPVEGQSLRKKEKKKRKRKGEKFQNRKA